MPRTNLLHTELPVPSTDNHVPVSLAYRLPGGFPDEVRHELIMDDFLFVLTSLRARDQEHGGINIDTLGPHARAARMLTIGANASQIDTAVDTALGWWRHLLPNRVIDRICDKVMVAVGHNGAKHAAELANMHSRTMNRVLQPRGPRTKCAVLRCNWSTPLNQTQPKGWTYDSDRIPFCPQHPAQTSCRNCGHDKGDGHLLCATCNTTPRPTNVTLTTNGN